MSTSQTVVVTGASSGLGFAIAKAFLDLGYNVVGNARSQGRLDEAAAALGNSGRFVGVAGDIALPETAERLFRQAIDAFGQVDILVNNAGIFNAKPFVDYSVEDLDAMVDTNLRGFIYPSQVAARHMVARKSGHIINITASIAMHPDRNVTAAIPVLIKGGMNEATRALALELSPHNVRVTAVAPGIIDTPMYTPDVH
jgi:NAD(P)-dependent dehydrogenase (short-subunit alcohol dehydrogenase family)